MTLMDTPSQNPPDLPAAGFASVTVLKLGGSLLTCPDLIPRLHDAIRWLQISRPLVVVGGGAEADCIRQLQNRLNFDDHVAHWLAVEAMSTNALQLERLDRRLMTVNDRTTAQLAWEAGRIPLLDTARFLRTEENLKDSGHGESAVCTPDSLPLPPPLPRSWIVTSDSIAAWIAARWVAPDLWLLKSCDTEFHDPDQLAANHLVDPYFPGALAPECRLHWMNLRTFATGRTTLNTD